MVELPKLRALIEKLVEKIQELTKREKELTKREKELKGQLDELRKKYDEVVEKNSKNSSLPPSRDGNSKPNTNKPNPKPAGRKKTKKRLSGGQKGHKGARLEPVCHPDRVVEHTLDSTEDGRKIPSSWFVEWEERQVTDIEPIVTLITAHRRAVYRDPKSEEEYKAPYPDEAKAPVNYGSRIKTMAAALTYICYVPVKKTAGFIQEVCKVPMSEGTVSNIKKSTANHLEGFEKEAVEKLTKADRLHSDETGFRVKTDSYWCHVYASDLVTQFFMHKKRGSEAMEEIGILPDYRGNLVVDFLASYRKIAIHADIYFCNPHLVRDLRGVAEQAGQTWPEELIELLYDGLDKVRDTGEALSKKEYNEWRRKFDQLLERGSELNPEPPDPPPGTKKKRGRRKRTKARNLINRLLEHSEGYLGFLTDMRVPFSNNDAERPLRMMKVQQKVSGCFRTVEGSKEFARVRGYLETLRKNGRNLFLGLQDAIEGNVPKLSSIIAGS